MNTVDEFVNYLAELKTPNKMSLNLYNGDSIEARKRRENLRYYLSEMKKVNPTRLFVGEAPGRWGCFITGIPFTDEHTLTNVFFFKNLAYNLSQNEKPQKEASASVIWERLGFIGNDQLPLMWNIYPFHPSYVDSTSFLPRERGNRHPDAEECKLGKQVLEELLACFETINHVYAIGCKSRDVLKKKFSDIKYIRHPSFGGASIFREAFNAIYGVC